MNIELTYSIILKPNNELSCNSMSRWLLLGAAIIAPLFSLAASYYWDARAIIVEGFQANEVRFDLSGSVRKSPWVGVAWADGQMFGYQDGDALCLKQYDRKTTPVGDDNVTFVLALYGDLLSADTIEAATKLPLCAWDTHEHSGGLVIDDPSDFYLGFMTPTSKTGDGIPRYGWYHLSIADDLNDITLLDSGVGLYGESVYVGIGTTPEPSAGCLLLIGLGTFALRRKTVFNYHQLHPGACEKTL